MTWVNAVVQGILLGGVYALFAGVSLFPGMAHDEDVLARVVEAAGEAAAEVSR